VVFVKHGVDRNFHYWTDIVNTLAPDWAKAGGTQLHEVPWVVENRWLSRGELMDEDYLSYIKTEKAYGVKLSEEALAQIKQAKPHVAEAQYENLYHTFNRTLLTARLHEAVATAYFGYRIYARGEAFHTPALINDVSDALARTKEVAGLIQDYPVENPIGQWNWRDDAANAMRYYEWITQGTWPEETSGFETGLNGVIFKAK